jgi:HlyD family secretion protein
MKVGDSVSASSSTKVVTVIGANGYTVTTSVPLGRIDIVKVGQTATVTTPSAKATLEGKVTSIGVLDVSTTSEPAYQVEIALGASDQPIYNGASAQVQISVAGASQVLTVPTSAVHVESGAASVEVLQNGKPVTVSVKRGAVGTDRTEITSGLTLGEQVVLADLQATIQSSSSSNRGLSSLGGNQTGFGGQFPGGFNGGGFAGGGFAVPGNGGKG